MKENSMGISYTGPVEEQDWAGRLQAHVVTPGNRPRIHGYDVRGDLLENISFPGLILLTLTGELPEPEVLLAFEKAMVFLAPVSVAEAPVHASVLAGLCGSNTSGMTGVAAITLAQQAGWIIAEHQSLFQSLAAGNKPPHEQFKPKSVEEQEDTELLVKALEKAGLKPPEALKGLNPIAAALTVLHECCNLTDPGLLEAVLVLVRIPCALAEGRSVKPGGFRNYPIDLPPFVYGDQE
jgi:hypothetical protein